MSTDYELKRSLQRAIAAKMKNHPKNRAMRAIDTEPDRLVNTLKAFVRNGQAAQQAVDAQLAKAKELPDAYCVYCAKERPDDFDFIREAQAKGCIVFTGVCPRHALRFFGGQPNIKNARIEDGKLRCEIGGITFGKDDLLPESGMLW